MVTKTPTFSNNISNYIGTTVVSADFVEIPNTMCNVTPEALTVPKKTNNVVPVQPRKPSQVKRTVTKKPNVYQYKFQKARTDKRVSLNVSPLGSTESFAKRVEYVLGSQRKTLKKGQTVYGFLYSCLSKSCGLIFPYTPQISVSHPVNYDSTDITHSNLRMHHYKNTPPPSYQVEATFTADTRENALHMLSALWFLRAVTKCDFGEQANEDPKTVAGMPPPILYLNGYNQIMDNIPVIVKSFNYSLPKDKDYVSLGINLDKSALAYNDRKVYSSVDGTFYDNYDGSATGSDGMMYLNGIANSIKNLQSEATSLTSNRYNNYFFNNWLPTEMVFTIQLEVQPNLLKYKKQFNLDNYKVGVYNLDSFKGNTSVYIPTKNEVVDCTNQPMSQALQLTVNDVYQKDIIEQKENSLWDKTVGAGKVVVGFIDSATSFGMGGILDGNNLMAEGLDNMSDTSYQIIKKSYNVERTIKLTDEETQKVLSGISSLSGEKQSYKFDKSGFTW